MPTVFALTGGHPSRGTILGVLSLVFWTLTMVTTIKYASVAMRVDRDGEGGILALMALLGVDDVTYYLGHETVVPRQDRRALPRRLEAMFAFMQRNSAHATDYFRLPSDSAVEIGRQVAI